jgi:hypothetical protein
MPRFPNPLRAVNAKFQIQALLAEIIPPPVAASRMAWGFGSLSKPTNFGVKPSNFYIKRAGCKRQALNRDQAARMVVVPH